MSNLKSSLIPMLFANCILVKGFTQALICDLQFQRYVAIPIYIHDILIKHKGVKFNEIIKKTNIDEVKLMNIFETLESENYLLFVDDISSFRAINLKWETSSLITNCIIDFDKIKITRLEKVDLFWQLSNLGCEFVQLRIFKENSLQQLNALFKLFTDTRISSVVILTKYTEELSLAKLTELVKNQNRLVELVVFSAPLDQKSLSPSGIGNIYYKTQQIESSLYCGITKPSFFTLNIQAFTEARHHNSCLNRKISIDAEGNIKNCPSMSQSFGNIKDTTLQEALDHPDFKKYWNITKDQIQTCKDCEFRYICTDCRAYLENPEDAYSKPLKCGYDPYTGEWEEWSTHPMKQKAIDYYGMREIL